MTESICLYHAECMDGAAAAAVVRHRYPTTRCIPVKHGDALNLDSLHLDGAVVFIVDFSFKPEILRAIQARAATLHWFDHHQTALAIQSAVSFGVLDLNESGASLTWKQLFPNEAIPPVIAYVRDKDIWQWKLADSRAINTGLANLENILDPTDPAWGNLFSKREIDLQPLKHAGETILAYDRKKMILACKNAFEVDFYGHRALALNWSDEASLIGEYIYRDLGYALAMLFKFDGKGWKFSLRSDKVDVAKLAETYGGGGHPGAAGFKCDDIAWMKPIFPLTT